MIPLMHSLEKLEIFNSALKKLACKLKNVFSGKLLVVIPFQQEKKKQNGILLLLSGPFQVLPIYRVELNEYF